MDACAFPAGSAGRHLKVSLHTASTYGSEALSSNVGSLSVPTTLSISSCARFCASGWSAMQKNAIDNADWI